MAISKEHYGEKYQEHLLEQYKLAVEMADRMSNRRQNTNSFFLSINTALIIFSAYYFRLDEKDHFLPFLFPLFGTFICLLWVRLLSSYQEMNSVKFEIITEIERQLPIDIYRKEWGKLGNSGYVPFTKREPMIPYIFLLIHFYPLIYFLYQFIQALFQD